MISDDSKKTFSKDILMFIAMLLSSEEISVKHKANVVFIFWVISRIFPGSPIAEPISLKPPHPPT